MMAGSRTLTVLPFVFLMLLMRCDGNALDLPVHLRTERATVTSFKCNALKDTYCVIVNVTECPVTAHVCSDEKESDGKLHINDATQDGCLIAIRGGINGTPFIEVFVDNLNLTKQANCTYKKNMPWEDTNTTAVVKHFNATKTTFCAGDAVCTRHHNATYDHGVCNGSIRDIAFRQAGPKPKIALTPEISHSTPEISNSTSLFEVFNSSSLYKSNFTSGHHGAMVEVYILETLDYQVHIDTETDVCVFLARKIETAEQNGTEDGIDSNDASIAMITVPICSAVICLIVILAFFFRRRRLSRRLDVPDVSHEAIRLQTVTTSNGSEESSRNNSNDGLIEEESTRV